MFRRRILLLALVVSLPALARAAAAPTPDPSVAPTATTATLFSRENLFAWCIVPYDGQHRTPAERAAMLKRLGLTAVAYDWREQHVPEFEQEILEYQKQGLTYFAFWSWHEEALRLFAKYHLHPQLWLQVPKVDGTIPADRVKLAAEKLLPRVRRAAELGCQIGLYNHGGWSGEPATMVAVLRELRDRHGATNVGLVYNFHHGHDHVDRLAEYFALMQPYLLCVNLNGMTRDGERRGQQLLTLGRGELDLALLRIVRDAGYRGPIGLIGHTQDDVEARLRDNLEGLAWLVPQLDGAAPGPRPTPRTTRTTPN